MSRTQSFIRTALVAGGLLALTACSNLDDTQQKMLSGGAAGAAIGTVGTVITGGCVPCGTVIGGAVGAGTGYVLDKLDSNTKSGSSSSSSSSYQSSSSYPPNSSPNYSNGGAPVGGGQPY
ncbi:MAG TPA: hypothetical protein VFR09_03410 [Alphaproteobacteria bacterium]|nr:hypothetical protein [Alphaproteobacteria bacterium]